MCKLVNQTYNSDEGDIAPISEGNRLPQMVVPLLKQHSIMPNICLQHEYQNF